MCRGTREVGEIWTVGGVEELEEVGGIRVVG